MTRLSPDREPLSTRSTGWLARWVVLIWAASLSACAETGADESPEPTDPDPVVSCISGGTEAEINAELTAPGDEAVLCQGATFELEGPVTFTADGQQLYTEGLPEGEDRAVLWIASSTQGQAIWMEGYSDAVLSHVIVDGNRPELGPAPDYDATALIQAGGQATSGQVIRNVKAMEPRTWSILHLWDGDPPNRCTDTLIEDSHFGPAGDPADQWSDGLSIACENSVIRNNTIVDATDGAIVLFGSPGTLVENNVIRAETRTLLGGIHLVSYCCWGEGGDYTNTRVEGNVIDAAGAVIHIAVPMGPRVWGCVEPQDELASAVLYGASVTGNTLRGEHMQYGFAVSGVRDWTVTGNIDESTHVGTPSYKCMGEVASPPAGFQIDSEWAEGTFQEEFEEANLDDALGSIHEP